MKNVVALIDWSHLIEDFLDNIGLSIEDFCARMTGGWMFGYIESLKSVGIHSVLFCFTAQLTQPKRVVHTPTGATIWLVPTPAVYRWLRKRIPNPYASTLPEAAGELSWFKTCLYGLLLPLAPYLATPIQRLAKLLKREACTHILCQDYEHARFDLCVALGKWFQIPVYTSFQGGNWQASGLEKPIRPLTLRACDGLIIASSEEATRVKNNYRLSPAKIAQIYNPIDLNMWRAGNREDARAQLDIPQNTKMVIWHGRIDLQRKGLDVLLDAWEIMLRSAQDFPFDLQLLILGSGNDHAEFATLLKKKALASITWHAEYINDRRLIATWLKAADVYVFPSRNEGFPVAPIEALACGLPLIASDAPGIPDILSAGESFGGIIVPKNNPQALASALQRVLQDDTLRQTLSINALRRAESAFALESVGIQLKKFMNL